MIWVEYCGITCLPMMNAKLSPLLLDNAFKSHSQDKYWYGKCYDFLLSEYILVDISCLLYHFFMHDLHEFSFLPFFFVCRSYFLKTSQCKALSRTVPLPSEQWHIFNDACLLFTCISLTESSFVLTFYPNSLSFPLFRDWIYSWIMAALSSDISLWYCAV